MTTETVRADQYRSDLIKRLEARDDYGFCAAVSPFLSACPDDTYMRLMAVRTYLKLNLVEPAKALVRDGLHLNGADAQLLEARSSIQAVADSKCDWEKRRTVFESNLDALASRGMDESLIREAWMRDKSRYELYRDRLGEFQVRYRLGEGDWRWYPGFGRHSLIDDARELPDDIASQFPGPYLFEGIGLGRYFGRIYERTTCTFHGYSCALYVLERDPARLAIAFFLNDWSSLLSDPRVRIFTGQEALGAFMRELDEKPDLSFPVRLLQTGAVFDSPQTATVEAMSSSAQCRERRVLESLNELETRYANRDVHYWSRRFAEALDGTGPPLRILASVSRHTTFLKYSMRDARRALEALGHECRVLTEDNDHTTISPQTYHEAIREMDPDLYFTLDHLRPEFGAMIPSHLPVLTWDQDQLPHVLTKDNVAGMAPFDFVAGCSKTRCLTLGVDASQLLHARVPTCPEQFAGRPLSQEETERFACDLSYVSHASETAESFHRGERSQYTDPAVIALLDVLFELVPEAVRRYAVLDRFAMSEVLQKACLVCARGAPDQALEGRLRNWYIWRLADRLYRHQALEWVGHWSKRSGKTFRIYGNGWEDHPTLGDFAAGPVANGRELLCVYRASKINLQLMPAGFIHQRALDGLAAGGFFLTRLVPHDLDGRRFAALNQRIGELGIEDGKSLLARDDPVIRRNLRDILGPFLESGDHDSFDLVEWIRSTAELPAPDQVFESFERIVFNSPREFADRADFFLDHPSIREKIAAQMRRVVVNRFSYRATMATFLQAMFEHLRRAAAKRP